MILKFILVFLAIGFFYCITIKSARKKLLKEILGDQTDDYKLIQQKLYQCPPVDIGSVYKATGALLVLDESGAEFHSIPKDGIFTVLDKDVKCDLTKILKILTVPHLVTVLKESKFHLVFYDDRKFFLLEAHFIMNEVEKVC